MPQELGGIEIGWHKNWVAEELGATEIWVAQRNWVLQRVGATEIGWHKNWVAEALGGTEIG